MASSPSKQWRNQIGGEDCLNMIWTTLTYYRNKMQYLTRSKYGSAIVMGKEWLEFHREGRKNPRRGDTDMRKRVRRERWGRNLHTGSATRICMRSLAASSHKILASRMACKCRAWPRHCEDRVPTEENGKLERGRSAFGREQKTGLYGSIFYFHIPIKQQTIIHSKIYYVIQWNILCCSIWVYSYRSRTC